jgi:hypothetical protein
VAVTAWQDWPRRWALIKRIRKCFGRVLCRFDIHAGFFTEKDGHPHPHVAAGLGLASCYSSQFSK